MIEPSTITVRVPLKIRRRPGHRTVVTPVEDESAPVIPTRSDPTLVKALARAFRYQRMLDEGRYASISELAAAEKIERGFLGTLLRLTLLAPNIVEAILDGRQLHCAALPRLLEPISSEWTEQREALNRMTCSQPNSRTSISRPATAVAAAVAGEARCVLAPTP